MPGIKAIDRTSINSIAESGAVRFQTAYLLEMGRMYDPSAEVMPLR
jgi:hypothetical protein